MKGSPYGARLQTLNLPSLRHRRIRGDMIYLYRIMHNNLNIDSTQFFTLSTSTATRGHNYKLYKSHAKCQSRINFFANRTVNLWNSLPENIVNADSVNSFKNALDSYFTSSCYNFI